MLQVVPLDSRQDAKFNNYSSLKIIQPLNKLSSTTGATNVTRDTTGMVTSHLDKAEKENYHGLE